MLGPLLRLVEVQDSRRATHAEKDESKGERAYGCKKDLRFASHGRCSYGGGNPGVAWRQLPTTWSIKRWAGPVLAAWPSNLVLRVPGRSPGFSERVRCVAAGRG